MRFCLRIFGCDLIDLYLGPAHDVEAIEADEPGDYLTQPIGFAPSYTDPRYEPCPQPGYTEE